MPDKKGDIAILIEMVSVLNVRFDALDNKVDALDNKVGALDKKVDAVETRLESKIESVVNEMRTYHNKLADQAASDREECGQKVSTSFTLLSNTEIYYRQNERRLSELERRMDKLDPGGYAVHESSETSIGERENYISSAAFKRAEAWMDKMDEAREALKARLRAGSTNAEPLPAFPEIFEIPPFEHRGAVWRERDRKNPQTNEQVRAQLAEAKELALQVFNR